MKRKRTREVTLEKIDATLDKQGRILDRHGKILDEHGKILGEHGKILARQGKTLDEHGKILSFIVERMATKDDIVTLQTQINGIEVDIREMKRSRLGVRVADLEDKVFGKTR